MMFLTFKLINMAESLCYICNHCHHAIEAWSDGNPYYIDETGKKQYAYHPDPLFDLCIGNDSPHLCLSCGYGFTVDSQAPITACPECGSNQVADTYQIENRTCPYCKVGKFAADPGFSCIS